MTFPKVTVYLTNFKFIVIFSINYGLFIVYQHIFDIDFSQLHSFFCFDLQMYDVYIVFCSAHCFDINKDHGGEICCVNVCACAHSYVSSSSSGWKTVVVWTHLRTVSQQRCYFHRWVMPPILWLRHYISDTHFWIVIANQISRLMMFPT